MNALALVRASRYIGAGQAQGLGRSFDPRQMHVTARSSKEAIIDASCELIDTQAEQLTRLRDERATLWFIVSALVVLLFIR